MIVVANNIFYVILSIVSVLITGVLVPLLKQKYGKEKIVNVMEAVDIAVKAAEQIYTKAGQGQLKKTVCFDEVKRTRYKIK